MQALPESAIYCAIGWRDAIRWRQVVLGITEQCVHARLLSYVPWTRPLFDGLNRAVNAVQSATTAGTSPEHLRP